MTNTEIQNCVEKYFKFLSKDFTVDYILETDYKITVILKSAYVSIKIMLEKRDYYFSTLIEKLLNGKRPVGIREGLGELSDLYNEDDFILHSFFLHEILKYKNIKEERVEADTFEENIHHIARLIHLYAMEFVIGEEQAYLDINNWMKKEVGK